LLWKSTKIHNKKNIRFTKKTLDYKSKLTHRVKMPRKCVAMPTIDIVQLIVNQR